MIDKAAWLDPRARAVPAILEAVNIPVGELSARVHELPSRAETIRIAGVGPEAEEARDWLQANGRGSEIGEGFEFGEAGRLRLWSPNPFLQLCANRIPAGRALDIACGSGRDAVYLASFGFDVLAVDHLQDALALGLDLARRYLRPANKVEWSCQDLDRQPPAGQFDLVTCFFYLNRIILRDLPALLRPGGHVLMETFTTRHRERFGKPRRENLILQPGELKEYAQRLSILAYDEDWHDERHTARLWASKPE